MRPENLPCQYSQSLFKCHLLLEAFYDRIPWGLVHTPAEDLESCTSPGLFFPFRIHQSLFSLSQAWHCFDLLTEKQLSLIGLGFPSEVPVLLPLHLVVMTDVHPCSFCSTSCQILSQQSLKKIRPKYYSRKSHLLRIGSFDLY